MLAATAARVSPFFARGAIRGHLGHGTAHTAIHVDVVEKHEPSTCALAGFNGVVDDAGPGLGPELVVVFEASEQVDDARAGDGVDGLLAIGQVGGADFEAGD